MRPYIKKHLQEIRERIQEKALIMKQHKLHFTAWLNDLNILVGETPEKEKLFICWLLVYTVWLNHGKHMT
jgi:hypothetical protein